VRRLTDGSLDLALLRPPVRDSAIRTEALMSEPLIVALPDSHPLADADEIALGDLAEASFVSYPSRRRSVVHDVGLAACAEAGFTPHIVQQAAQTSALVSLVAAGLGVALVPESVSHLSISGIAYRPIRGRPPQVELVAAYRVADTSPHLARVLQVVRSLFADSGR
jgi:DNA-binding transcriptional LysR family regulator